VPDRPYEREWDSELPVLYGRIRLDCGTHRIVADIRGGTAEITLVERFDQLVHTPDLAEPVRRVGQKHTLRLTVEADLNEMTIDVGPKP
jgi:hypothetical protein